MPESPKRTKKPTAPPAGDSPLIVTYDEHQYKIPRADDWPSDALEHFFDGNLPRAAKLILGEDVYAKFNARHPRVGDLGKFLEKAAEASNAGN